MGEYLHQNYLTLLRGEDRLKIKEQVVGTWFKEWICHCNVLLKWVDPIEFKKEYDTPTPAPEPINDELPSTPPPIAMKPKGLKLGVQVS